MTIRASDFQELIIDRLIEEFFDAKFERHGTNEISITVDGVRWLITIRKVRSVP